MGLTRSIQAQLERYVSASGGKLYRFDEANIYN
jgi:hypothetical protein